MAYLINSDLLLQIQDSNLQQIISANQTVLDSAMLAAQAEAISYLRQKYEVDSEFTDTTLWSYSATYKAGARVYLNATAYSATSTYALHTLCLQTGNIYICSTAITVAEAFNISKWTLLGAQYEIFYAAYPKPVFNLYGYYVKDEEVFWANKTYSCVIPTSIPSHDAQLQASQISNLPYRNVFPNDSVNGVQYWGAGTAYVVAAGTLPTNTTYFSNSDNRDQQMKLYFIDITLFHLHSRISPRNIPQLRIDRYNSAIEWLKMCAKGEVTPALTVIQPKQGARIRFGGNVRNINSY